MNLAGSLSAAHGRAALMTTADSGGEAARAASIRITYVLDSLGQGGAESSLLQIIAALSDRVDADLVVLRDRPDLQPQAERQGLQVTSIAGPGGLPRAVARLTRHLRQQRPDLVHTSLFQASIAGRLAARCAGIPVVSSLVNTPYGPDHLAEPGLSPRRVRGAQLLDSTTCRLVRRFHANAEHVATTMADRLRIDPRRIDVIPRGRDPVALGEPSRERTHRARASLGIDAEPLVLALGRAEHVKGFDVLLSAIEMLRHPVTLVIAGRPGNASPALQAQVERAGLDGWVRFLGFRDDVPDLLAAADLLVLPSRREGFPGVLIEALALEVPIVASDLPGVREVTGEDTAWLVPVGEPSALAAAIGAALSDQDEAQRRAGLGRARFLERFTIDRTADEMLAFYLRATERRPAAGRVGRSRRSDPRRAGQGRLLHVLTTTQRRGAEVLASELAPALDRLGWSSDLVALTAGDAVGLDVPALGGRRLGARTLWRLRRDMRGAAVVIAHGSSTLPACFLAGIGTGVPVVYRSVGDPRYWAPTTRKRIRTGLLMRRSARVVALTGEASATLQQHYGLRAEQVVVITKGVATERLPQRSPERVHAARSQFGLPEGRPVAAYLGALSPEKNVAMAIRAAARWPDLQLVLAGDGPDRAELEELGRGLLAERFFVLGQVPDPLPVLTAADVLLLPSWTEGMPGVAMEAGIVGVPVVTTDVGWVRDVVLDQRTGVVVAPGDEEGFAEGIVKALDQAEAMGEAGRDHCLARFGMANVASRWSTMLDDLACHRPR